MIKPLHKIIATIGVVVSTSFFTYTSINAKSREAEEYDNANDNKKIKIKDKDKKKDKRKKKKNKKEKLSNYDNSGYEHSLGQSAIEACVTRLSQWREVNGIPGVVVGVSLRGQPLWTYADGYADIENSVKCNEHSVMRIASISKSITATLLARLLEEDKLDLNASIHTYLTKEQFPDKYWEGEKVDITLGQLVSHLGGIRHYKDETDTQADQKQSDNNIKDFNDFLGEFSRKEYYLKHSFPSVTESLKLFKDDPLVAKPGTKFVYTTFGWTLISAVIETQLGGQQFEKYLVKFMREQLGMDRTYLDQDTPIISNRCSFYTRFSANGRLVNTPYVNNSYKWAGGGLLSTVGNLVKFANIMLYSYKGGSPDGRKGFLKRETVEKMWTAAENTTVASDPIWRGYGIGWVVERDAKSLYAYCAEPRFESSFSHGGGAVGASSMLFIEPKHEIVIAIITNLQSASGLTDMAMYIAEQFTRRNVTIGEISARMSETHSLSANDTNNDETQL